MMRAFKFIPYARLDDLMVSYAAPGGGVGAHFDSYDVFLVQGSGRRRWHISTQRGLTLDPHAPLKIVRGFRPERRWVLETGDMLYLPPHVVHEGTALGPCFTYSIGFRAPSERDLAAEFLTFLQDHHTFSERLYADPDLRPSAAPAAISTALMERCARMIDRARRWRRADVAAFIGTYLSEPKRHITFVRPSRPLSARAFAQQCMRVGVRLVPATGMLYRGGNFYVNGEAIVAAGGTHEILRTLANARTLAPRTRLTRDAAALLYAWYQAGFLEPGDAYE
jgi:50S ribosomal protein L16 3-hydroxylase